MYGVSMPSVDALAQDFLTTALPSWMTLTRGAGSWSYQSAAAVNGTTFIELGTAQNTGRFDYADSVGRSMLLIEPTRVNSAAGGSLLVDVAPDNDVPDGWTGSGTAGDDFTTSTTGRASTSNEVLLHLDTGVASRGCYVNAGPAAGTYVWSAWVRRQGAGAGNALSVTTIHQNAGAWLATSLPLGPYDWTRHQASPEVIGGAGIDFYTAGRLNTAGSPLGTLGVQLPMLEAGDCASSYTSGTRAAELCAIDPGVIGRTSGLVQFLWRPDYASTAALTVDPVLLEWAPGWELMYDVSEDKLSVVVNSVTRAASSALTFARGDLLRLSVRYSSAGQQLIVEQAGGVIDIAEDSTSWADPGALVPYLGSRAASVNCRPGAYGDFLSTEL